MTPTIFDQAPFLTFAVSFALVALFYAAEASRALLHGFKAHWRARRARVVAGYVRKGMGQWEEAA
jgi:hypothetical protein